MKRRMGPIAQTRHESMLDRIVMDIIHVPNKIRLASYCVFPKSSLPQRVFAVAMTLDRETRCNDMPREMTFDVAPATRKVSVSGRQGEDRVHVVRQNHDRIDRERTFLPGAAKGCAQCV